MKNQHKTLIFGLIILGTLIACQGKKADSAGTPSTTPDPVASTPAPAAAPVVNLEGKKTFETYCILCHGVDGKLGLNGSKDLSISTITTEERIAQVTNGKGLMTPFKEILTEAEIKAVVEYTESLKK